ncbi:MAG: condensation domain-containing protein, partial [Cyanobacteria bacterium J06626_18]
GALSPQPRRDESTSLSIHPSTHPPIYPSTPSLPHSLTPPTAFIIGGEALHAHDLAFWQKHFPNTRFINEYGPTEAVVGCCIYDIPLDFDGDAIPIGHPIANVQLYVLDPYLNLVPIGIPGELYIGGVGVARGYLNRPELTAERFVPNPFVEFGIRNTLQEGQSPTEFGMSAIEVRSHESGARSLESGASETNSPQLRTNNEETIIKNREPRTKNQELTQNSKLSYPSTHLPIYPSTLYKTGDRARYRLDGTLEYLGRMDDQIKLRGYRIEPGEIETVLCQHSDVEQAVVVLRDDVGEAAKLVAYVVLKAEGRRQKAEGRKNSKFKIQNSHSEFRIPNSELRTHLSQHLPPYMVPDYFVVLDAVPLTVNGKVDRQALPVPAVKIAESSDSEPRTEVEARLAAVWAAVLRRDSVRIHDNFFELGGDSILGMQIIAKAHQVGLHLTPRQLFQHQTVAELAAVAEVRSHTPISQDVVIGAVPLTPIQRDFFAQNLPEPHHFNQAIMVTVAADMQSQLLEQALQQLVMHHDGLRSRFFQQDGEWQQVIQAPEAVTVPLDDVDLSDISSDAQATTLEGAFNNLQASLNLAEGLLFRAALLRLGDKGNRLLLIAHHLVVDGVSWRILLEDLVTAYHQATKHSEGNASAGLPPKTQSFQSWAHQLINLAQAGGLDAERAYWQEACAVGASPLPMDFERDAASNTVASVDEIVTTLDAEQTQKLLEGASQSYNAQVNEVLLAALGQTLKAWTQSSTVLIDLEGHGRQLPIQNLQDLQVSMVSTDSEMDISRTVGWFTALYPLRLTVPDGAIADQLKAVKEQLRHVPNQGIGYGILRYLFPSHAPVLDSPAEISFNYLGQINAPSPPDTSTVGRDESRHYMSLSSPPLPHSPTLLPSYPSTPLIHSLATEPVGQLRSPLGQRRHLLEAIALVREGQLQVIWRYSRQAHRRATVEAIAERYLATLRSHLTDCSQSSVEAKTYTPSDFAAARVNQAQLDQLLSKIRGG